MQNPFIANNNLDEIVFARRNKAYGAYALRKEYNEKVTRAFFIVIGALCLLFTGSFLFSKLGYPLPPRVPSTTENKDFVNIREIIYENPAAGGFTEALSRPVSSASAASSNPNYTLVTSEQPVSQPPATNPADHPVVNAGPASPGDVTTGGGTPGTGEVPGTGGSGEEFVPRAVSEIMPAFAQGDLYEYLAKHIHYPEQARITGVQGKVFIMFDVLADGRIANVKLKKGIGFGCDDEALRVIRSMPAWKPGLQDGKAVPVRLILPIQFSQE